MPSSNARARFEELKKQILELGFVRPGSLVRRYMPCGNPSCRCMGSPPRLHGPYYQWSYKIAGKSCTVRLLRTKPGCVQSGPATTRNSNASCGK